MATASYTTNRDVTAKTAVSPLLVPRDPSRNPTGGGLLLLHSNGIVIRPSAEIGVNCLIFQQVTIGTRGGQRGAAQIGGHVDIGAGAKILGPVTIGDHARIGANSVVLQDVPAGKTAVGLPARIL